MARSRPSIGLGLLAAGTFVFLAGCDGAGVSDLTGLVGDGGTGRLTVQITDDPFPHEFVAEAWVTITRIDVLRSSDEEQEPQLAADEADEEEEKEEVDESADEELEDEESDDLEDSQSSKGSDGDDDSDADAESGSDDESGADEESDDEEVEDGDSEGDSPFLTVFESEEGVDYDLVELRNGRMADLVDAEIPAGRYKQMRIFVSGGRIVLMDGREFPLRVPSGDRSGIKLHFEFEIVDGEESELLLDFDLSRAFKPIPGGAFRHAGEIREFIFRPSLGMRMANLGISGCLSGELTDGAGEPRGHATVTAFRGDEEFASSVTEEDGSYRFVGLPPGEYRLVFEGADFDPHELIGQMVDAHRCRDHEDEDGDDDDDTDEEEVDEETDEANDSSEDE